MQATYRCWGLSPARFCRQLGNNKQLSGIVDSRLLTEAILTKAKVYWRECMRRQTRTTLAVSVSHFLRNVIIHYVRWWHGVVGATCIVIHISGPLSVSSRRKRKWGVSGSEQLEDPPLLGEHPSSWGGRRWVTESKPEPRRLRRPCLLKVPIWAYFADIGLDLGEPTNKGSCHNPIFSYHFFFFFFLIIHASRRLNLVSLDKLVNWDVGR